jgi:DNA-binding NtrC family response regulator
VATELNALALLSTFPVARLDAVRILAMALVRALESGSEGDPGRGVGINLRDEVQRFEANLIKSALAYTGGRQRRAARLLGINVSTMNERIKRYKLNLTELKAG